MVSGPAATGVVVPGPTGPLMNNGTRDMSSADLQKLQQQLHDIKEQVSIKRKLMLSLGIFKAAVYSTCLFEKKNKIRAQYLTLCDEL